MRPRPKQPGLDNENAKGVFAAMQYLTGIQSKNFGETYNKALDVKEKNVVVIGGGDTAMDCVRTAKREGARSVTCLYRRDAHNMPGSQKEYKNAKEEGVDFTFYAAPKQILTDENGKVIGIEMIKTALGQKDESGRARIEEVKGSEFKVSADMIIMSLGFDPVVPSYLAANGIETNEWGGIVLNDKFETTSSGIFAGGDCYRGADLVVTAAFDGREAARAIAKSLH